MESRRLLRSRAAVLPGGDRDRTSLRAGSTTGRWSSALGINVTLVFAGVFARSGPGSRRSGGILGGPILGMYPTRAPDILVGSY